VSPVRFFALYRVYVDEAGDRGLKPGASAHFVVSAVLVQDALETQARSDLAGLRQELGRQPGHVLHFRKLSHLQKVRATQAASTLPSEAITNVIICKQHLQGAGSAGQTTIITRPDPMYLWALRLLLERVSWYIRDHGGGTSIVTFAHVKRFKVQKLHDYRRALSLSDTNIHWPSFDGHAFRVSAPNAIELLQVADITASALLDAVEPQYGNVEDRYLRNISGKLYRYSNSPVTSYGLKGGCLDRRRFS